MKFLIDAQISYKVSKYFSQKGFDVVHVNQLPLRDRTPDLSGNFIAKIIAF
jgi:predicted nuclease of predicted toxin-antitoxin system